MNVHRLQQLAIGGAVFAAVGADVVVHQNVHDIQAAQLSQRPALTFLTLDTGRFAGTVTADPAIDGSAHRLTSRLWTSETQQRRARLTSDAMSSPDIAWLSTKDAARYLGITPRTLYRLIDAGELPAYKFGRVIRLQQADVDSFIQASRVEPGTLKHLYPDGAAEGRERPERSVDGDDED